MAITLNENHPISRVGKFGDTAAFYEKLKNLVLADGIKIGEMTEEIFIGIAKNVSEEEKAMERSIAQGIVEHGMQDLRTDAWFRFSETLTPDKKKAAVGSNGAKLSMASIANTGAGAWPIPIFNSSGRYGSFFEDMFFKGGGGNESESDIKLKLEIGVDVIRKVLIELKTAKLERGRKRKLYITGEKFGVSQTDRIINNPKHAGAQSLRKFFKTLESMKGNAYDIAAKLKSKTILAYTKKLSNLAIVGVENRDLDVDSPDYLLTSKGEWLMKEDPRLDFYYTYFYYYYRLLIDNLIKILEDEITVKKVATTFYRGTKSFIGFVKPKKTPDTFFDIKNIDVYIKLEHMPEEDTLQKAFSDIGDMKKIYLGRKTFWDVDAPGAEKAAEAYFNKLLNEYYPNDKRGIY